MSLDGKLTRHNESNIKTWTSLVDQVHFHALLEEHDCEVLGSGTYKAAKHAFKLNGKRLRIVLTKDANIYSENAVAGRLEFSKETSLELIDRPQAHGYKKLLVVGGPKMIADFLSLGIVNKLYVTIEPVLFGNGKPLVTELQGSVQLKLIQYEKLNRQGTLLLTYLVC